jgi:hypothetical protein
MKWRTLFTVRLAALGKDQAQAWLDAFALILEWLIGDEDGQSMAALPAVLLDGAHAAGDLHAGQDEARP